MADRHAICRANGRIGQSEFKAKALVPMSKRTRTATEQSAAKIDRGQSVSTDYVLTIDTVATMFKLSPFRLRLFELRGLIRRHDAGGIRVYSWFDCERIALIVKARKAGYSIGQIAPIVKAMDESATGLGFKIGRDRCLSLIGELKSKQDALIDLLAELHRIDWEFSVRHTGNTVGITMCPGQNTL